MKFISFKDYLKEMASGEVGKFLMRSGINSKAVENPLTRQTINAQLAKTVGHPFLTPYIALGAVQRILAYASIVIPQYVFLDKEQGEVIFDVNQFGRVDGINLDGSKVVDELADKYYVFFAYEMNDEGTFDVIAQLVNSAELQDLMDVEEDVDEDLAEEPMCADDGKKGKLLLEPEEEVNEDINEDEGLTEATMHKLTQDKNTGKWNITKNGNIIKSFDNQKDGMKHIHKITGTSTKSQEPGTTSPHSVTYHQ